MHRTFANSMYVYNLLDRKMTLFNAVWGKTLGSIGGKWAIADKGLGIST